MARSSVESRLAILEAELARLKARVEATAIANQPWWEKIAGTFEDDAVYEEAMRLGREWRESFRPKSRRRRKKQHGGP